MYKENTSQSVLRLADGAFIPFDNGSRDYGKYQEWLADGNTPEPADQPVPVNQLEPL